MEYCLYLLYNCLCVPLICNTKNKMIMHYTKRVIIKQNYIRLLSTLEQVYNRFACLVVNTSLPPIRPESTKLKSHVLKTTQTSNNKNPRGGNDRRNPHVYKPLCVMLFLRSHKFPLQIISSFFKRR